MKLKVISIVVLFMIVSVSMVTAAPAPPKKMRPYAGIGILLLPIISGDSDEVVPLYDEPGLSRQGELNKAIIPALDWIFGTSKVSHSLIVTARKGPWLRVSYDDAGREAWLNQSRQFVFQPWDLFLKGHVTKILPGVQKKYYQLFQQPGELPVMVLTIKQPLKVLRLEDDWAMVLLIEQNLLGWLRWRDEDGRLLMGLMTDSMVQK